MERLTANPHPLDAAARDELARRLGELLHSIIGCESESDVFGAVEDAAHFARQAQEVLAALLASVRGAEADTRDIRWQSYRHGFLDGLTQPTDVQRAGYETWSAHAEAHASVYADAHTIAARAHPPTKEPADAK